MRIGIDGYNLAMPHGTGVATYGYMLAKVLKTMGHQVDGVFGLDVGKAEETREVNFFDQLNSDPGEPRTKKQAKQIARRIWREALDPFRARPMLDVRVTELVEKSSFSERLPAFDRLMSFPKLFEVAHRHFGMYGRFLRVSTHNPPDVMHWTYPVPIRMDGARNVYTLHDIVPLRLPYTTLDRKRSYRQLLARCMMEADHICTVSEASKADICSQFGLDPLRITNTYQSSSLPHSALAASPEEDGDVIEGVFGLPRRGYFLFFGAIEPKKNLGRLIEAFLASRSKCPLVIVGSRSWQADEELKLLPKEQAGYGSAGKIIRLEYLSRTLLVQLIRGARAVAFPSLYEGFGLPLLEAMQLGTPVITSRVSSMPEIGGDAVSYVDPYDVSTITKAIKELDHNPALRETLSAKGLVQAGKFDDAHYRERLAMLYSRAMVV